MSVNSTNSAGDIKQIVQIELLKQQNDIEKSGVQKLYSSLESVTPAASDTYIPSGGAAVKRTYTP